MPHIKKAPTNELKLLYKQGYSCAKISDIFSMSRQAVWERLITNGVSLRTKKILPFIMYNGIKFTPSEYGYYRATQRTRHISLHRYKYIKEIGKISKGFDIHHIDGNRQNNAIENLEHISKSEHTRLYSPHHNQYKNNKTLGLK